MLYVLVNLATDLMYLVVDAKAHGLGYLYPPQDPVEGGPG